MSMPVLLRFVVLSITCLAGVMLLEANVISRLRGKKIYAALLIFLYLCVYWSVVYTFFLQG